MSYLPRQDRSSAGALLPTNLTAPAPLPLLRAHPQLHLSPANVSLHTWRTLRKPTTSFGWRRLIWNDNISWEEVANHRRVAHRWFYRGNSHAPTLWSAALFPGTGRQSFVPLSTFKSRPSTVKRSGLQSRPPPPAEAGRSRGVPAGPPGATRPARWAGVRPRCGPAAALDDFCQANKPARTESWRPAPPVGSGLAAIHVKRPGSPSHRCLLCMLQYGDAELWKAEVLAEAARRLCCIISCSMENFTGRFEVYSA